MAPKVIPPAAVQVAYYAARAAFAESEAALDRLIEAAPDHERDYEEFYTRSGWYATRLALTQAESALVDWAFVQARTHKGIMGIQDEAGLEKLAIGWRKFPKLAADLIQACVRLRV